MHVLCLDGIQHNYAIEGSINTPPVEEPTIKLGMDMRSIHMVLGDIAYGEEVGVRGGTELPVARIDVIFCTNCN